MRLSAIIPTYNRGPFLGRAVRSVLAQERGPDEIIVVDDGSTDDTKDAAAKFGDRVRYIRQSNAGASAARNHGVRVAEGEWIAFLDSDDVWTPGHIHRMRAAIDHTDGRAGMYFADSSRSDATDMRHWQLCDFDVDAPWQLAADPMRWLLLPRQPMMIQSSVFDRAAYRAVGGCWEDLRRRNDTHLFFRVGIDHPICAVQGVGVDVRTDDVSSTRLTVRFAPSHPLYHLSTVKLYNDVLSAANGLPAAQRRTLRSRVAAAHLALARAEGSRSSDRIVHAIRAVVADPATIAWRALGFARSQVFTSSSRAR